jgi:hypothetical protein
MKKNLLFLMATVLYGTMTAWGTTTIYRVNPAATGTGNGSTWEDAFTTLVAAIDAKPVNVENAGGDTLEIWVKAGTYPATAGPVTANLANGYYMYQDINVYGGFAGTETARDQRNWKNNETILTPSAAGKPVIQRYSVNTSTIRYAEWDGFTITGVSGNPGSGSAVQLQCGCTLRNSKIINNSTSASGNGLIFMFPGATLENCIVTNNVSTGNLNGFAILVGRWQAPDANEDKHAKIINCTIVNNKSDGTGSGAIVVNSPYSADIYNTLVANNTAGGQGGGVIIGTSATAQSSNITNCTVVNNVSSNAAQSGIYMVSSAAGSQIINTIADKVGTSNVAISYTAVQDVLCTGTGNIQLTDNQFINPTPVAGYQTSLPAYDWNLLSSSACINAGNNAAAYGEFDLAGNERIQNSTIDLGAYESPFNIPTGVKKQNVNRNLSVYAGAGNQIVITNAKQSDIPVQIYNITGQKIAQQTLNNGVTVINGTFGQGIYLVKVNGQTIKIAVN